ncbi:MAG: sensor histidine kinase [Longimicrobiales bacterium]
MTLQRSLMALVAAALFAGLVPLAVVLDQRLRTALEQKAREDLELAPFVLKSRVEDLAVGRMMHAKELSGTPGLAAALASGDDGRAESLLAIAASYPGERPLLVGPGAESLMGPFPPAALVDQTRDGGMPVQMVLLGDSLLATVAIAPVMYDGNWVGAAGIWVPVDMDESAQLAALTRTNVLISFGVGTLGPYSGQGEAAMGLQAALVDRGSPEGEVVELTWEGDRYLLRTARLDDARVTFVRNLNEEMAIVPALRRAGLMLLMATLAFALVVGGAFASRLAKPIGALAAAADRLAAGDFDTPVPSSAIREVEQVREAFDVMRVALADRLQELRGANRELADGQARLGALQAEMIQRDRLATAGRLLTTLAHEIRNPVANVRNCLEILRRRVATDPEARDFADMAIDELLRMHELAEQMLDLHRPRDPTDTECDAGTVAREVASLMRVGLRDQDIDVSVTAEGSVEAAMPPETLKQILLNVTQNACDAISAAGDVHLSVHCEARAVVVEVQDTGPGIQAEILPRIFDPFFTTKASVDGVGLGLFTAEGLLRGAGGRMTARNRDDGPGAIFRIELPAAPTGQKEVEA